jgi:hypothetical protein
MALKTDSNGSSVSNWAPATDAVAITKSDSTNLTTSCIRAIYVGGTGDVAVIGLNGTVAVTFSAVPAGTILPIMPSKVMSTNTTATLLIGLI